MISHISQDNLHWDEPRKENFLGIDFCQIIPQINFCQVVPQRFVFNKIVLPKVIF